MQNRKNQINIERDYQDLQTLTNTINSTTNPLSPMVNQNALLNKNRLIEI